MLEEDRWVLTAEFAPPDTNEEMLLGEAAEFYGYMLSYWGEENEGDIEWIDDTNTVRATSQIMDHFAEPLIWIMAYTIPLRFELRPGGA